MNFDAQKIPREMGNACVPVRAGVLASIEEQVIGEQQFHDVVDAAPAVRCSGVSSKGHALRIAFENGDRVALLCMFCHEGWWAFRDVDS